MSRIALVRYSATTRLLSIQIDAAINPGPVQRLTWRLNLL